MTYDEKKDQAIKRLLEIKTQGQISLKPKFTSHFFRTRIKKNKLNLTMFNKVINVDTENKIVEVEGLCTFYNLAKETLKYNLLPVVVPELRNITIGGTIAGLGDESSSFKFGMVHNSIIDCEVLTSTGEVINCSRDENSDLFYTLPNSLGTIGYVLKCRFKLIEAKKYVKVKFLRYSNDEEYFKELQIKCNDNTIDFIDGVIYGADHFVIIVGQLTNDIPQNTKLHNFKQDIYWKFIRNKENSEIYMNTWDYLWRWDTDAFWSLSIGWIGKVTENKIFRESLGRIILRSNILGKLNHIYTSLKENKISGLVFRENANYENIIQDLCLPIENCYKFINWYSKNINVFPLWICPSNNKEGQGKYPLHNFKSDYLVDIGIYTGRERKIGKLDNYYNKLLEEKLLEYKGMKGLYSESFFTEEQFWSLYNKDKYFAIKKKYDPESIFTDILHKAIGRKTA